MTDENSSQTMLNERTNERTVHCLFEQSGTFKNEFRKLGIHAYDYDILNDFGQTDYQIDLFAEINNAYNGKESIFDTIAHEDLIIAFFPCTRFEDQILLSFRGERYQIKNNTILEKMEYATQLHNELHQNYITISHLVILCIDKGLRIIIENPYSEQHYLRRYWPLKPSIVDKDRTLNGDKYRKPTQFFFVNCKPKQNLVFEPIDYVGQEKLKRGYKTAVERSLIHPQYANRFIRQFILNEDGTI